MLVGSLNDLTTEGMLSSRPAWKACFDWLIEHSTPLPADGEYPLPVAGVRALVQRKQTRVRSELLFEAHRKNVDVQVCIGGSEWIEWLPLHRLAQSVKEPYDETKEAELYAPPAEATRIAMFPGVFAIFFPEDAHMPGIRKDHDIVEKVVFKVPYDLVR